MAKYTFKGYQDFLDTRIPIIESVDSSYGKRWMLVNSFEKICGVKPGMTNRLIRVDDSIYHGRSIINMIDDKEFTDLLIENDIIKETSIKKSKSIYILTEQGCLRLLRAMKTKTDRAKCLYNKNIRKEYFN